jgi:hypothetical protein
MRAAVMKKIQGRATKMTDTLMNQETTTPEKNTGKTPGTLQNNRRTTG